MNKLLILTSIFALASCTEPNIEPTKISTKEQYQINLTQIKNSIGENNIEPLPKNYKAQIENKIKRNRKIKCKQIADSIEYGRKESLASISNIKGARRTYYLKEIEYQTKLAKNQYNQICSGEIKIDYSNSEKDYLSDYPDKVDPTKPLFKRCIFGFDIVSKSFIETAQTMCFQNGKIVD